MAESGKTHRVVIVGAGFAGFSAARELVQLVGATTEVVVINSTDYFLYLPLMPQVAGGMVELRHICLSLPRRLRKARFVLGTVDHVDSRQKVVSWSGPEGASGQAGYDRLILTAGSVNRLLPIPGVAAYARVPQHRRSDLPARPHHPPARAGRGGHRSPRAGGAVRCTFVVIGAGYTGTEVTAQGQLLTARLAGRMPGLAGQPIRWMLLDTAHGCCPTSIRGWRRPLTGCCGGAGWEVRTGHARAAGCDQAADARRRRGSRS